MLIFERGGLPVFIMHSEIPKTLGLFLQFIMKVFTSSMWKMISADVKANRQLVPAKFVYVLVHMCYLLAVKYKHKLQGESFSAWEKTAHNDWHLLCSMMSK